MGFFSCGSWDEKGMTVEDAWLAGIIEGEACIDLKPASVGNPRPRVRIKMADKDIVERVAMMFGTKLQVVSRKGYEKHWKTMYIAEASGQRARDIFGRTYPLLGERRQEQIRDVHPELPL